MLVLLLVVVRRKEGKEEGEAKKWHGLLQMGTVGKQASKNNLENDSFPATHVSLSRPTNHVRTTALYAVRSTLKGLF
jgi:hypothetical protein